MNEGASDRTSMREADNEAGGHMAAQLLTPRGEEPGKIRFRGVVGRCHRSSWRSSAGFERFVNTESSAGGNLGGSRRTLSVKSKLTQVGDPAAKRPDLAERSAKASVAFVCLKRGRGQPGTEASMRRKPGLSPKEAHARDGVVRTAIGRMLAAQYDLAEPLSERLENLLKRFENTDEGSVVDTRLTRS